MSTPIVKVNDVALSSDTKDTHEGSNNGKVDDVEGGHCEV